MQQSPEGGSPSAHQWHVARGVVAAFTALTVTTSVSACTPDGPPRTFTELSAMDMPASTLYVSGLVTDALDGTASSYGRIDDAQLANTKRLLAGVLNIDPTVRGILVKMNNDAIGSKYLQGSDGYDGPSKLSEIDKLPDVPAAEQQTLQQAVQEQVIAGEVEELSSPYNTDISSGSVRKDIQQSTLGAAKKQEFLNDVDVVQAIDDIASIDSQLGDPSQEAKQLAQITDPTTKQALEKVFETGQAQDILQQLDTFYMSQTEATKRAAALTDPALRAEVQRLVGGWKYGSKPADWDAVLVKIIQDHQADEAALRQLGNQIGVIGVDTAALTNAEKALTDDYESQEQALDKALAALAIANGTPDSRIPDSKNLQPVTADPATVINLNGVHGMLSIPDTSDVDTSTSDDADYGELPKLSEFASVKMVEGQPRLDFHANKKLTAQAQVLIAQVFNRVKPLLLAAFKGGELNTVRLTIGDDFNPYYDAQTREEIMALPDDDSMSVNQLTSAWTHETIHSLVRDVFYGDNVPAADTKLIVNACMRLKSTVTGLLESTMRINDATFAELQAQVKPEDRVLISDLRDAATTHTLSKAIDDPGTLSYQTAYYNECDEADHAFGQALGYFADLHKIDPTSLDYLYDLPAFTKFANEWSIQLTYGDIYSKLNESNFVETNSPDKQDLGHSEDNANEMAASLLDAMLTYPDALGKVINGMAADEQKATVQALSAFTQIVMSIHPQLQPIISDALTRVQKAVK